MIPIKTYIADSLVGKRVHFQCECIMNIDVKGIVRDWSLYQDEIIWNVFLDNGKMIKIGENHPNMNIEIL